MAEFKTTKVAVTSAYKTYAAQNGELDTLLSFFRKTAYIGDDDDAKTIVYILNDTAITTGNKPFGEPIPESIAHKYNEMAMDIDRINEARAIRTANKIVVRMLNELGGSEVNVA